MHVMKNFIQGYAIIVIGKMMLLVIVEITLICQESYFLMFIHFALLTSLNGTTFLIIRMVIVVKIIGTITPVNENFFIEAHVKES